MIRFNIARNLFVASALLLGGSALGGCVAQSSSPGDADDSDNPFGRTELVAMDGNGPSNGAPSVQRGAGGPRPVGIEARGPQPEPWTGIDDPNGAPQPEPWHPRKIVPDPDPASPSAAPPKP